MTNLINDFAPLIVAICGLGLISVALVPLVHVYRLRGMMRSRIFAPSLHDGEQRSAFSRKRLLVSPWMKQDHIVSIIAMAVFGNALAYLEPVRNWGAGPRIGVMIMAIYIGYRIPFMRRERKLAQHRAEIERDLPAMIDLLVVMLEAGATFDDAVLRLVKDPRFPDSAIKQELARLMAELAITPQRQIAFQKFASSTALNDLRLFSSVLVQSENFGTPVSKGLQSLAFEIRERMSNTVEARGSSLGPKLAIPMTLFFLPLIFIVVLTPTIIRAFRLS